jgi:hypothetical protein
MRLTVPILAILFVACGLPTPFPTGHTAPTPAIPTYLTASCHYYRQVDAPIHFLPDPNCTPGVADTAVREDNIKSTICRSGYTRTVRPPVSFTDRLKRQQMLAYGDTDLPSAYEEDHLIALEIGGKGNDPRNLWPEPIQSAHEKDMVENAAHKVVCDGHLALNVAQTMMAQDWVGLGKFLQVL